MPWLSLDKAVAVRRFCERLFLNAAGVSWCVFVDVSLWCGLVMVMLRGGGGGGGGCEYRGVSCCFVLSDC